MFKDKIKERMIEAFKAKRMEEKVLLSTVLGEIQSVGLRSGDLDDEQQLKIVKKFFDNNLETIQALGEGERADKLKRENVILSEFLPKLLTVDEIGNLLASISDKIKSMPKEGPATGIAMGFLKKQEVAVDGKDVVQAIKRIRE